MLLKLILVEKLIYRYMVHVFHAIFQQVCISKSAVRTKFEQHSQRGRNITSSLRSVMDETHKKSQQQG